MTIRDNVRHVQDQIAAAAARAGRKPEDITLVAVSKTHPPGDIEEAAAAGITHFGENRVQEADEKIPAVAAPVVWHLVGHLQSNKAARAVPLFSWIDSLDSVKIAEILDRHAANRPEPLDVLVQVNISGESTKSGVRFARVRELARYAAGLPNLRVRGIMTIGSLGVIPAVARMEFARMRELFEMLRADPAIDAPIDTLSMGMSGDYGAAVEEGATMVRIGSAVFGARPHG